jgi:dTDP-4-dehydrorhamnose reductase
MIVVLGATGYVGQAFVRALEMSKRPFLPLSRATCDYSNFRTLVHFLETTRPEFLINAAGFTGKPNVDACEHAWSETLTGNTLLPLTISQACAATGTPWGHVSSGCIYQGAFVRHDTEWRIETDLNSPAIRQQIASAPDTIRGFRETDPPNFCFRNLPCSFYSGTKALAEEALANDPQAYVWRLRIPFHAGDHPRNYLTKLLCYSKVYDAVNSLSHLDDFVTACLALWERKSPFGIYNVTNPGFVTTRQVIELFQQRFPDRSFQFWESDEEFYRSAAKTLRSNCVLDSTKLLSTGVSLRGIEEALTETLEQW